MSDRLPVIFVARPVGFEEAVQRSYPLRPEASRLETQRNTVIGECDPNVRGVAGPAEMARRIPPQTIERLDGAVGLLPGPFLLRKK